MANNIDVQSVGTSVSKFSQQSAPSRQSVIQFQLDFNKVRNSVVGEKNKLSVQGLKANSENYFAEISFDSLRFQYCNVIEAIVQSNRRMNLYFRVAGVNKGSLMCEVFAEKYRSFQAFHNALLSNKLAIEKQIHFYWTYVKENVDVDLSLDRRSVENQSSDAVNMRRGARQQSEAEKSGYFSREKDHFQIKVSKIPGAVPLEHFDAASHQDYKSINRLLNEFQRQNTVQL